MLEYLKQVAFSYLGVPYIWGGDDPIVGMDCSGGAQELLAVVGMDPPGDQTAQGLYNYFMANGAIPGKVGLGALAFYGTSTSGITHVAVMMDDKIIFEFGGGGSSTTSREKAAQQNAVGRLRPLRRRSDLVAVLMPNYGV